MEGLGGLAFPLLKGFPSRVSTPAPSLPAGVHRGFRGGWKSPPARPPPRALGPGRRPRSPPLDWDGLPCVGGSWFLRAPAAAGTCRARASLLTAEPRGRPGRGSGPGLPPAGLGPCAQTHRKQLPLPKKTGLGKQRRAWGAGRWALGAGWRAAPAAGQESACRGAGWPAESLLSSLEVASVSGQAGGSGRFVSPRPRLVFPVPFCDPHITHKTFFIAVFRLPYPLSGAPLDSSRRFVRRTSCPGGGTRLGSWHPRAVRGESRALHSRAAALPASLRPAPHRHLPLPRPHCRLLCGWKCP